MSKNFQSPISWLVFARGRAHLFGDNEDNRTLCGLSWEDHPDEVLEETVDDDAPDHPVCARCARILKYQ